ncbi:MULTISPECIES: ABC transporter permease [Alteribacter]|uniref:ABC transporter permease n=1 Tax=Alteribacter keqinensis TaxID=2483800 RepID=A0A3M7TW00_9BACI|nr:MULTISPECIES: ABC transporter permease [Alteribacter]MBM7096035.1 ABC transporter permease [Alteribacter salitolerans]RNA69850.1 ABC transporter permease [Alteribacter keqinensis]
MPVTTEKRAKGSSEDRLFVPVDKNKAELNVLVRPSVGFWKDAWQRLLKNKLAVSGLVVIIALTIMAIIGPMLTPYSYSDQTLSNQNMGPSREHWFGTDNLGRDMFTRTWYGARISLFIGFAAALIEFFVGVIYGGVSGYKGGRTDNVMMRIIDILYGLPYLLVVILLMVIMGPGLFTIIVALTLTGWIGMARIVRGQVLQLKTNEYVLASKVLGADTSRIIRKHLLPNTMGPVIVSMTLTVPGAIFAEAFLSFLGLGVSAPVASWGSMANDALGVLNTGYWWRLFFPAFFISLTMLAFNVFGDGLRDALDPKLRR